MKPITILLTCCLGDYMKTETECLTNNEDNIPVKLIGVDMRAERFPYHHYDSFYVVPRIESDGYISRIYDISKEEQVDLIIPCHSSELELFHKHIDEFAAIGVKICLTGGNLAVANDKAKWASSLNKDNVNIPCTYILQRPPEVNMVLARHQGKDFCLKIPNGCGGRGMYLLSSHYLPATSKSSIGYATHDIILQLFAEHNFILAQEYLDGDEYTVDMLCDKGNFLCGVVKKNNVMDHGIAMDSEIVDDDGIMDMCKEVSRELKIDGLVGYDLIKANGKNYLIDINPRRTATISLAYKAGLNLLWHCVKRSLGIELPKKFPAPKKVRVVRKMCDFFF